MTSFKASGVVLQALQGALACPQGAGVVEGAKATGVPLAGR